jgi:hypothetical protein
MSLMGTIIYLPSDLEEVLRAKNVHHISIKDPKIFEKCTYVGSHGLLKRHMMILQEGRNFPRIKSEGVCYVLYQKK